MARFCENCGTELGANDKFCTGCGAVATAGQQPPSPQQPPQPTQSAPSPPPQQAVAPPPSQPTAAPTQRTAPRPTARPAQKSSAGPIVLGVALVGALGYGGYYGYTNYIAPKVDQLQSTTTTGGSQPAGTTTGGANPAPSRTTGSAQPSTTGTTGTTAQPEVQIQVEPRFSVANGKVTMDLPGTWSKDVTEPNFVVASRDTGMGTGERLNLVLSDVDLLMPQSLEELHELHLDDLFTAVDPAFGLQIEDENYETVGNGIRAKTSIVRADYGDGVYYYHAIVTLIHNGHGVWIEFNGPEDLSDDAEREVERMLASLRVSR